MSMLCALGGHEAASDEVYNGGYYFSRCRRCAKDMIRCGAAWQMVPSGHRVVWKSGRNCHSVEPSFAGVLPVLHRDANLPAVRPPFSSWSRDLAGRRSSRRERKRAAAAAIAADPEREELHYPRLLVVAALVGAGLQLLLGLGSGRGALG